MKAKHAGRANPNKKRRKKKSSFKKRFLGTDVRTVSQLVELKCSTRRKLVIAKQLKKYADEVLGIELEATSQGCGNVARLDLAKQAVNDWNRAVRDVKRQLRENNIERSKTYKPFKGLYVVPAAQK